MKRLAILAVLAIATALVTTGCPAAGGAGASSGSGGGASGTLRVQATDAPFPAVPSCVSAVSVTIDRVQAQRVDGGGGFVDVPLANSATSVTVNLLDLRNGLADDLAIGDVPSGTYHQIRVFFAGTPATIEFTDGTTTQVEFDVPSMKNTGLKVNVQPHFVVANGQTTGVLLDFDLGHSFKSGQNPRTCDEWKAATSIKFKPVIHATNIETSGVLAGNVTDTGAALEGTEVAAFAPGTTVDDTTVPEGATFSDANGDYAMRLPAGTYDVWVRHDSGTSRELLQANVVIDESQTTTQDVAFPLP